MPRRATTRLIVCLSVGLIPWPLIASPLEDRDGDGWNVLQGDCDDSNPDVNPQALEACGSSEVDRDCDGLYGVDDPDTAGVHVSFSDEDGDGYGDPTTGVASCEPIEGGVSNGRDCDDTVPGHASDSVCGDPGTIILSAIDDDGGGSGYSSIQDALDRAPEGATLWVEPGTYYVNLTVPDRPLTLQGMIYGRTRLDGSRCPSEELVCSVVNIIGIPEAASGEDSPTLRDLVLSNGTGSKGVVVYNGKISNAPHGGNLLVANASPYLEDLILTDGFMDESGYRCRGGGAAFFDAEVRVNGLVAIGNRADDGGAMSIDNSTFKMSRVQLIRSVAFLSGGLQSRESSGTITDFVVKYNTAEGDGGGVSFTGGTIEINGFEWVANGVGYLQPYSELKSALGIPPYSSVEYRLGGGAEFYQSRFTLKDGLVEDNMGHEGGGIYSYFSLGTFTNIHLKGNYASVGAGLLMDSGTYQLEEVDVIANRASNSGSLGVFYANVEGSGLRVEGNSAGLGGGGISLRGASATLSNSVVQRNITPGDGGGILSVRSTLRLSDSEVSSNRAGTGGGGILSDWYGGLFLNQTEVIDNTSLLGEDNVEEVDRPPSAREPKALDHHTLSPAGSHEGPPPGARAMTRSMEP